MSERRNDDDGGNGEPTEQVVEEIAAHNPDPITRRESLEQELMQEGRSAVGEHIDDAEPQK